MSESFRTRIEHLETLYAEQEYTVQALNDMVARQDRAISSLGRRLEQLRDQLESLQTERSGDVGAADEKPPHY